MEYSLKELVKFCEKEKVEDYENQPLAYLIKLLYTAKEKEKSKSLKANYLRPLFKWTGSKDGEFTDFLKYIPEKYTTYVEMFAGGASLFFYLEPARGVLNDIDEILINFYYNIKQGKLKEIAKFMEKTPKTKKQYDKIRTELAEKELSPLENAKYFYYLRKLSSKGMNKYEDGLFVVPYGEEEARNLDYSQLLSPKRYETLLKRTSLHNESYEAIFKEYGGTSKNFIFIDPPYDSTFQNYGFFDFTKKHQENLARMFKKTKAKCMIIINKTPLTSRLYHGFIKAQYEKVYRYRATSDDKKGKIGTIHLVVCNY
jgi:DNA adenine methylase